MSIMAMAWASTIRTGDPGATLVLRILADEAGPKAPGRPASATADGRHYVLVDPSTIAGFCEMTPAVLARNQQRLAQAGLIQFEERSGRPAILILPVDDQGPRPFDTDGSAA